MSYEIDNISINLYVFNLSILMECIKSICTIWKTLKLPSMIFYHHDLDDKTFSQVYFS